MRIVIDAYQMRHNITGTDRQARNILRELQDMDHDNSYVVMVNRDEPFVGSVVNAPNFEVREIKINKRASWIYMGLPILLVRMRANVFYSFHNMTAPGLPVCPTVVSCMDLIPFMYQKRYYRGFLHYWVRRPLVLGYMKLAAKTGTAFWAISDFTMNQAMEYFHIDKKKFKVAYLQADPVFAEAPTKEEISAVRDKYHIEGGFVYAIGGAEPRKNNLLLIKAHKQLPDELREKYPLVIAGAKWQGEDLADMDDPYIKLAGYVTDDDHAKLYHEATVFVCASKYEGFGLPVLEAMTAGTPVIAADATSLPEVTGDAAILFDPDSQAELTEDLHKLLSDGALRQKLSKAGLARVKRYSWRSTAEAIHALMLSVARP